MSFRRYPAYKRSGAEWLEEMPAHWNVVPMYLRYSVDLGKMLDTGRITGEHLTPYLRNVDVQWGRVNFEDLPTMDIAPDEADRFTVRDGDLLVCEGGEVGRAAVVAGLPSRSVGFQKALHRLRAVAADESPQFMFHTFRWATSAGAFASEGQSTIAHLTGEQLRRYRFPKPPIEEQTAIAAFLDRETSKIDALGAEQERLIALLKEKRRAIISDAVTKGLDPDAPMKRSGIEWIGSVPAHWVVKRLKHVALFKAGAGFPEDLQGQTGNAIPFFKVGNLGDDSVMRDADHTISVETAEELRAFVFPAGTIVFAKVGAALLLRRFRLLGQPSCIDNNMMGMIVRNDVSKEFLLYVLPLLDFSLFVNPGAVPSINEKQISSQDIVVPPPLEQAAIVQELDREMAALERLIEEATSAVTFLKERRSALISAAVTGQIDVRGLA